MPRESRPRFGWPARACLLVDGDGSDPLVSRLPPDDRDRLNRAADLCGARALTRRRELSHEL